VGITEGKMAKANLAGKIGIKVSKGKRHQAGMPVLLFLVPARRGVKGV